MREKLGIRNGQRLRVRAKIERYGTGFRESTYLLTDVSDARSGEVLSDHLWMSIGKYAWGFRPGDTVEFDALVSPYEKGYERREKSIDFQLINPTNGAIVVQGPIPRAL